MAPTTTTATTTTAPKAKVGRPKKTSGAEPTRRSTRTITPRTIFSTSAGVTKPKAAPRKRKTTVKDKVVGAAKKVKGTITRKPAVKAAGTKRMRGTDGRGAKKAKHIKA
ncbi:hypothetical protein Dda_4557 [Drechslerella dactyloides]|uniref:Uncharacterized protein n=1 Tax=Drechslerella dactyloides TaxID=74499 RepID=A0AAD6NJD9_DREDA|nr:hypothetical protein Dda_4557 [Drechslerella dactyloides]